MMNNIQKLKKVEYGDFQTPPELAEKICQKLISLQICPDFILEPTCGVGNFIEAAIPLFQSTKKIIGIEINKEYLQEIRTKTNLISEKIELHNADFFQFDWSSFMNYLDGNILILGNFPWVTNSKQGNIEGKNLPKKNNFQHHPGLDAITGKSNFDISEWMLIQMIQCLQGRDASLAMLCKTSVSRKLLNHLHSRNLNLAYCATYKIDAKRYFEANVEACLLFCKFDSISKNYFCHVFNSLNSSEHYQIGYRDNLLIKDVGSFETLSQCCETSHEVNSTTKWRSGIKHDCSSIMEFRKIGNTFVNGRGEVVELEDTYLFPLLKGSDVAQGRTETTDKYVLVTQQFVGESTERIKHLAPKTWNYLESHANVLANRKSKIYQKNPQFSIFGVGPYTFSAWKIAICGLYKKLDFRLIGMIAGKPVIFDDTVYFLNFENQQAADEIFLLLTSTAARQFYSSLIFWDDKRPIKSSILNRLNLTALAEVEVQTSGNSEN